MALYNTANDGFVALQRLHIAPSGICRGQRSFRGNQHRQICSHVQQPRIPSTLERVLAPAINIHFV